MAPLSLTPPSLSSRIHNILYSSDSQSKGCKGTAGGLREVIFHIFQVDKGIKSDTFPDRSKLGRVVHKFDGSCYIEYILNSVLYCSLYTQ